MVGCKFFQDFRPAAFVKEDSLAMVQCVQVCGVSFCSWPETKLNLANLGHGEGNASVDRTVYDLYPS